MTEVRVRREPPAFTPVRVAAVEPVTPWAVRVALEGDGLGALVPDQPAASVRLLIPSVGTERLEMPRWNGNEFRLAGGDRPVIRTLTPLRPSPVAADRLDVEVVLHEGGALSAWAAAVRPGAPAAVSGPGRGYEVDAAAPGFLVVGDESALPAIGQVVAALPPGVPVSVQVELAHDDACRPGLAAEWHVLGAGASPGDALSAAVREAELRPGTRVWAAGEAAAVQRLRTHLFDERGVARSEAWVRGYWKAGRAGGGD